MRRALAIALIGGLVALGLAPVVSAQTVVGVTATEIKIGNTNPYSGPASAYGTIGKALGAYFKKVNDEGGINGRKITYITLDDGYSPPKTVEMVRRLVEQDQVAFVFQTLGTPTNSAIHKYMNQQKVPHLFVATGATKWNDPKNFPWTMGFQPNYQTEGRIYAAYVLKNLPDAKVGILYQNDDYGKDYLKGFEDGLGPAAAKLIVLKQSHEVTDPTIDSQIINLKNAGANVFFNITIPKFAVQAIKKAHDIGWKPTHFLNNVSSSLATVLKPAGLEASKGLITALYMKEVTDPQWKNDKGFLDWVAWMKKYYPEGSSRRPGERVRLQRGHPHDAGHQAVRERPLAGEHHEAGGQHQELRAAPAPAGNEGQHQPDRFRARRAGAARQVRRRAVGGLRRRHRRLPQAVGAAPLSLCPLPRFQGRGLGGYSAGGASRVGPGRVVCGVPHLTAYGFGASDLAAIVRENVVPDSMMRLRT